MNAMTIINDQVAKGIEPTLMIGIGPYPVPANWGQFVTKVVTATKGVCALSVHERTQLTCHAGRLFLVRQSDLRSDEGGQSARATGCA